MKLQVCQTTLKNCIWKWQIIFKRWSSCSCADPGIFVRGGPGQSDKKRSDNVFFFSPQLILLKSNGQFQRNLSFFKVPEGVQHFPGGVQLFPGGGGSNCLFPIETHIICDFPRGREKPVERRTSDTTGKQKPDYRRPNASHIGTLWTIS